MLSQSNMEKKDRMSEWMNGYQSVPSLCWSGSCRVCKSTPVSPLCLLSPDSLVTPANPTTAHTPHTWAQWAADFVSPSVLPSRVLNTDIPSLYVRTYFVSLFLDFLSVFHSAETSCVCFNMYVMTVKSSNENRGSEFTEIYNYSNDKILKSYNLLTVELYNFDFESIDFLVFLYEAY